MVFRDVKRQVSLLSLVLAVLELRDLNTSASQALRLKVCVTSGFENLTTLVILCVQFCILYAVVHTCGVGCLLSCGSQWIPMIRFKGSGRST